MSVSRRATNLLEASALTGLCGPTIHNGRAMFAEPGEASSGPLLASDPGHESRARDRPHRAACVASFVAERPVAASPPQAAQHPWRSQRDERERHRLGARLARRPRLDPEAEPRALG